MKQENYDFLKQFESNMQTAAMDGGYSRHINNRDRKRIAQIYEDEAGIIYTDSLACGQECLIKLLISVKPLFDAHNPESKVRKGKDKKENGALPESDESRVQTD